MAEEPEVKVVDFDDAALFDINGLRYELSLENSHLIQKVDQRLAKIPAKKYGMKVFTITVPYLFEVPGLDKYLDVNLSIDCQPWDYKPDSHYVSTNLGIESARLRDKREDERVEAEKVVVAGDYEKREGLGDSYAIKQNDNWVVYGAYDVGDDDYFAPYHNSVTYKIKDLDDFDKLPDDVPVYVSSFTQNNIASAREMDEWDLEHVFITKKQVLKDAAALLKKHNLPATPHNQVQIAKEMIKKAGTSDYHQDPAIEYTNREIDKWDYQRLNRTLKYEGLDLIEKRLQGEGESYAEALTDGRWAVFGTAAADDSLPSGKKTYRLKNMADQLDNLPADAPLFVHPAVFEYRDIVITKPDNADFVTKKLLMDKSKELLTKLDYPETKKNLDMMAKELLSQADYGRYDAGSYDIQVWSSGIDERVHKGNENEKYSQLDGFYKDLRIEKAKNQELTEDSNANNGLMFEGETLNDFILTAYGKDPAKLRNLDYKQLNKSLERAGLVRLDRKRFTPKFEGIINGQRQLLSEHDVISQALKTVERNYETDQTKERVIDYLRNAYGNPPKKRLKLAMKILKNTGNVQLLRKLNVQSQPMIYPKKAKER